ncbi:hypothetical protein HA402_015057 [Bradysia odoriphaga]|nr:hypothetical protein HA402_015057 [Bradysia odoriphaga]
MILIVVAVLLCQMSGIYADDAEPCGECLVDLKEFDNISAQCLKEAKNNPNEIRINVNAYNQQLASLSGSCISTDSQTIIDSAQKGGDDVGKQSEQTNDGAGMTIERIRAAVEYALPLRKCKRVCIALRQLIKFATRAISELSECQRTAHGELSSLVEKSTCALDNISPEEVSDVINKNSFTMQAIALCQADEFEKCKNIAFRPIQRQISNLIKAIESCLAGK